MSVLLAKRSPTDVWAPPSIELQDWERISAPPVPVFGLHNMLEIAHQLSVQGLKFHSGSYETTDGDYADDGASEQWTQRLREVLSSNEEERRSFARHAQLTIHALVMLQHRPKLRIEVNRYGVIQIQAKEQSQITRAMKLLESAIEDSWPKRA